MKAFIPLGVLLNFTTVSLGSPIEPQGNGAPVFSEGSLNLGAEARAERIWSDEGFSDIGSDEVPSSAEISLTKMRLMVAGKLRSELQYSIKFDLLESKEKTLQYGHLTYTAIIAEYSVGFSLGKMKVHQGGWDQKLNGIRDHVQGNYRRHFAFSSYEPMLAVMIPIQGKLTLQLVNDVTIDDGGQWNEKSHLTPILGWFGELGTVDPLLAYGSYDNNKSYWLEVGFAANHGGFSGRFDTKFDSFSNKVREGGEVKNYADRTTSHTLKLEYAMPELVRPWMYMSKFERIQYESQASNKKDAKVNASTVNGQGKFIYALDDNALTFGTGIDLLSLGPDWTPFAAWITTLATFADPANTAVSEQKSLSSFHLGCTAEL